MINLGTVKPGSTIYVPFETFNSSGAPVTLTGLATSDILIYKDGGTTQRASTSGFTLLDTDGIDFDSLTGIHGFSVDLADDTTVDFYKAGSKYFIVLGDVTVDSQTMRFLAASFQIGYPGSLIDTYIATLATQTSFTLNAGPAEDDALNGMECIIHDKASAVQLGRAFISDYTGSTKTVTLAAGTSFTAAQFDNISVFPSVGLAPTVQNALADSVLLRNVSNVESTAGEHTLCTLVLAALEFSVSGATWTIKRTDGSTTHYTKTLTTDAGANPITGVT